MYKFVIYIKYQNINYNLKIKVWFVIFIKFNIDTIKCIIYTNVNNNYYQWE